jgi:N-acetylmuramoyl-L-alanine amidase
MNRKIRQLIVHCAATYPSMDVDAKWIDRVHRVRGFDGIGYHYFIKRDGTLETGRDLERVGAHARGHNTNSIGVCLAGGLVEGGNEEKTDEWEDNFDPRQMETLGQLIADLRHDYPGIGVLGHRDLPGVRKDCPSFDVRKWMLSLVPSNNRMDN